MRLLMTELKEGVSRARKLYVETNRIPSEVFDQLVALDPTENKKYIEWMAKMYVRERPNMERFSIIATFHDLATRNIISREESDINRYQNMEALDDKVRRHEGEMTKSEIKRGVKGGGEEAKEDEKKGQVKIAFENDKCLVVLPLNAEASCKYGRGSRWCTAAMGSRNYFDDYRFRRFVNLYYIIPKEDLGDERFKKIAVAVYPNGSKEYYDNEDSRIEEKEFNKIRKQLGIR